MSEALLEKLGVTRIALPVPFRAAGGPVNVYAFEEVGGGIALFDAGIKSEEGERALREGLAARNLKFADVRRIFISHGHIDHFGLAALIQRESQCAIFVHARDRAKVLESSRHLREGDATARYLAKLGLDAEQIASVQMGGAFTQQFADGLTDVHELRDGEKLTFAKCEVAVLHLPGHTPGLVCLWDEAHRVLFADDHLLERVSPNPLLDISEGEPEKFRALSTYLESARRAQRLPAELICPGHGEPFSGHAQIVERLLEFYEKRQSKLLELLASGPRTALELVPEIFGRVRRSELYLQLSEIVGNLEVLEDQARVRREFDGTVYRYARC